MDKKLLKEELLEMLINDMDEMIDSEKELELPEGKMKATIVADSPEGLLEGAEKLPKALTEAEKYMEARMGEEDMEVSEKEHMLKKMKEESELEGEEYEESDKEDELSEEELKRKKLR